MGEASFVTWTLPQARLQACSPFPRDSCLVPLLQSDGWPRETSKSSLPEGQKI